MARKDASRITPRGFFFSALYGANAAFQPRSLRLFIRLLAHAAVVGYDQVGLHADGGAKGVGASFIRVDGEDLTLKDISVTGYGDSWGSDFNWSIYCQKLTPGGATASEDYVWLDCTFEGMGVFHGWYNNSGEDRNDIPLTPAEGVWMFSPSTNIKVVSSGQVPTAPIAVYLHKDGGAKLVTNPMPVTATFGEYITVKGYGDSWGGDFNWSIYGQRLTPGGATASEDYVWLDCTFEGMGVFHGWYNNSGEDRNSETLPAGEALYIYSPSDDYYVEFKSPLEKPVED